MEPANPLLPALRPDTPALLRRTGSLLGAVQGIQQEASADYWYAMGLSYKQTEEWGQAALCFNWVVKLNDTHWRGWLLAGLSCAHLGEAQKCRENIFGAEKNGRPIREADFLIFLTPLEREYLLAFLIGVTNETNDYESRMILALVYFYCQDVDSSKALLLPLAEGRSAQATWSNYFLVRIGCSENDHGNRGLRDRVGELQFLYESFVEPNSRIAFWIGKAQFCIGREELASFREWELTDEAEEARGRYFDLDFYQVFGQAVYNIKRAISIGPARAEHYFLLGEAYRIYGGRGAGFDEYHEAVNLDPHNEEYIMVRYRAMYDWPPIMEDVKYLIAFVAAADICPYDIRLQRNVIECLCDTQNYASCLLMFNKFVLSFERGEMIPDPSDRYNANFSLMSLNEYISECMVKLDENINMKELQVLADAERAGWKESLKSQEF